MQALQAESKNDSIRASYQELAAHVRATLEKNIELHGRDLFTVKIKHLSSAFLESFEEAYRQEHNCSTCRRFISMYGNAVYILEDGSLKSALWDPEDAPAGFEDALATLKHSVESAGVVDTTFYYPGNSATGGEWGAHESGGFNHLYVPEEITRSFSSTRQTNRTCRAAYRERHRVLVSGLFKLGEARTELFKKALLILQSAEIQSGEKFIPWVKWLYKVSTMKDTVKNKLHLSNLLFKEATIAPNGWCEFRDSTVGTLLENIQSGMSTDQIIRFHNKIVAPWVYQRPTAAPTEGNVQQAEKLIAELGLETALQRRFATLDEVLAFTTPLWSTTPEPAKESKGGIFGDIARKGDDQKPKAENEVSEVYGGVKTFDVFARTILPTAQRIRLHFNVPRTNLGGILTGVDPAAGRLFSYETDKARNPFNWYVHVTHPVFTDYSLNRTVEVLAVLPSVPTWKDPETKHNFKESHLFVLEGAVPKEHIQIASCLFPEILRSELHGVRATIEAYSSTHQAAGRDVGGQMALGWFLSFDPNVLLEVKTDLGWTSYRLDRFE
jgi:hypothetical protein